MKLRSSHLALLMLSVVCLNSDYALGQNDTIYRTNGGPGSTKISCKVVNMSPDGIIAEIKGAATTIPPWQIRSVSYSRQPGALPATTDRIKAGNFTQGLQDLVKYDAKGNPFVAHELAYLKATCEGNLALKGSFGAVEAGKSLNDFLSKYKKSYHFYPATELKGRLLFSLNYLDLASAEFQKLPKAKWPEYANRGHYHLAQVLNAQSKFDEAISHCEKILASSDNDAATRKYQLLAKCLKAKTQALKGTPGTAEADLKKIIKVENPDNTAVFGAAYNALGVYYLKADRLKEAREKFLLTHLLMYSEADLHAESLYYLTKIWGDLDNSIESSKARELLKSRYRNSYWAQITE